MFAHKTFLLTVSHRDKSEVVYNNVLEPKELFITYWLLPRLSDSPSDKEYIMADRSSRFTGVPIEIFSILAA